MCYDKNYLTKRQERYAQWYGRDPAEVEYLKEQLNKINLGPVYHASGFDHPLVPVITEPSMKIELYSWGLIPFWVKTPAEAVQISNRTINARAEACLRNLLFVNQRAPGDASLWWMDFFKDHHKNKKTFPRNDV